MGKRIISIDDLFRLRMVDDPQVSPDGLAVVFVVRFIETSKNRYLSHVWMGDIVTGAIRQFTHGEVNDQSPRWSPDGKLLAFVRTKDKVTQIWVMPKDGGEARQLTQLGEGAIGQPAWAPDGRRVAFAFRPSHPEWTKEAEKKRKETGASRPPRVLTRIHYRVDGAGFIDLRSHIWMCGLESGEAKPLTADDVDYSDPAWSPDGRWIACAANRCEDPEGRPYEVDLWLIPVEGGELKKVHTPLGWKGGVAWSPDGRSLAYIGVVIEDNPWKPRHGRLWVVPLDGGTARCLTASLDRTVGNVTIGDLREAFHGDQAPIWSSDGSRLFFLISEDGGCHIYSAHARGEGAPERLTEGSAEIAGFSMAKAGQVFGVLVGDALKISEVFVGQWGREGAGGLEIRPFTHVNDSWHGEVQLSCPEEFWVTRDDGVRIQAWVLKPPEFDPAKKYPLLFYIHGGPAAQYGHTFFHELQLHAARGYVVAYANPRGSGGYTEAFMAAIHHHWGSVDFEDLMAVVDTAEKWSFVDPTRMAVAGGSYGGYMTNWMVGHTDRFRCAVTDRSVVNLHSDFGTCDFAGMPDGHMPGDAWDHPERMWELSPLKYAARIRTPLLIIHSEGDLRCPIEQAEQLFTALKRLKREVVFVRYPAETSHGLSRIGPPDLRVDRLKRIGDWLDQHLTKGMES